MQPSTAQLGLPFFIDPPEGSVDFGRVVDAGGDADGDGIPDILIIDTGREIEPEVVRARWYVYSSRTQQLLWSGDGFVGDALTHTITNGAFVGDVNRDGFDDIAIGQPGFDSERGRVDVLSGLTGEVLLSREGTRTAQRYGRDVKPARDVDNDGWPDLAIIVDAGELSGEVQVISGRTGREFFSRVAPDARRVAPVGDVNGDGHADLAVGPWRAQSWGVMVISGLTGDIIHLLTQPPSEQHSPFGYSLAGEFDLNDDDVPDIVVNGAGPQGVIFGYAYVYSGATGELLYRLPEQRVSFLGLRLGDVNGDGRAEVTLMETTALSYDVPASNLVMRVIAGRPRNNVITATELAVRDLNGDGFADLIGNIGFEPTSPVGAFSGAPIRLDIDVDPLESYAAPRGVQRPLLAAFAAPGARIHWLASRSGADRSRVPGTNFFIDLTAPVAPLGSRRADSNGEARITLTVPPDAPLGPVWVQAVEQRAPVEESLRSNVMRLEIVRN